jgi:hypothetical protein
MPDLNSQLWGRHVGSVASSTEIETFCPHSQRPFSFFKKVKKKKKEEWEELMFEHISSAKDIFLHYSLVIPIGRRAKNSK